VAELEPAVKQEGLKGAPLYYDCSTDDARLTIETALDAVQHGAVVATYARVESFLKDENGRIQGAVVKCQTTGQLKEVRASVVVNATGPWTDKTMAMSGTRKGNLLRPTKGVHIVVEYDKLPISHAVVCFHPTDERVLFALPWGDRTYIGTTDTDYEGDAADVSATLEDVDYLIAASNSYFPDHPVGRTDVIATWAGLRPLIAPPSAETDGEEGSEVSESKVSREHQIVVGQDGLITIAGGKLTRSWDRTPCSSQSSHSRAASPRRSARCNRRLPRRHTRPDRSSAHRRPPRSPPGTRRTRPGSSRR
jgi:glycerol-3-phosphate dehydrogenase